MIVFPMLNCTWILLYHISHDCSFCGLEEKYYCKYDFFFFFCAGKGLKVAFLFVLVAPQ